MMHYRMGNDSAPDRIAAMRGLLADDPDLAEVLSSREMRRNPCTDSMLAESGMTFELDAAHGRMMVGMA